MFQCEESVTFHQKYFIIEKKGFTNFGIGVCLVRITNALLGDENTIISVSTYNKEHDLYISTPAILGRSGIVETMKINLTKEEQLFLKSVEILKQNNN